MKKPMRVGVLFGGRSQEHEVSLMSAESIVGALDPNKYEVIPIAISKTGDWFVGADALAELKRSVQENRLPNLQPVGFVAAPSASRPLALRDSGTTYGEALDVIFPVLHGPYGEDGTVQGLFELADVPYVGCGVAASAVGMDKALMKAVFQNAGLPVLDWIQVLRSSLREFGKVARRVEERIGYPCFVKPANLGSSVGVSRVDSPDELEAALREAARHDRKILVEKAAIGCREVECAVLGNDAPEVSVAGEIVPAGSFYDYRAKYLDAASELVIPARISQEAARRAQAMSKRAFQAIDGSGLARVDFFVNPATDDVWVNEINTMPGFTRFSMYPKLWEASGLPYPELLDRLIELAIERHQERRDWSV